MCWVVSNGPTQAQNFEEKKRKTHHGRCKLSRRYGHGRCHTGNGGRRYKTPNNAQTDGGGYRYRKKMLLWRCHNSYVTTLNLIQYHSFNCLFGNW